MITIKKGDVLRSRAMYICHQVNCMGVMGAGIAKQIKAMYPEVYEEYKRVCNEHRRNPAELLGQNLGVSCQRWTNDYQFVWSTGL